MHIYHSTELTTAQSLVTYLLCQVGGGAAAGGSGGRGLHSGGRGLHSGGRGLRSGGGGAGIGRGLGDRGGHAPGRLALARTPGLGQFSHRLLRLNRNRLRRRLGDRTNMGLIDNYYQKKTVRLRCQITASYDYGKTKCHVCPI